MAYERNEHINMSRSPTFTLTPLSKSGIVINNRHRVPKAKEIRWNCRRMTVVGENRGL